ncbi:MAG: 2-C-methyl-D-erythritol 4-phosphate cytidylyltransferase [Pseudomonadota bacterium]|jgi:2-C-methyl-D-erythritol 4-phosphate cytidylyltransferase|uniref:2-C-methyl-D-erythritol 4-phosphate cytidylyltransferase n=1 Tax=Thiothrix fructosivorans TaxID=111770 RepID=A0A8B0SFT8_9GAMM|nr:2-C-methyl-D-erythritol 4-phosphate cytidylyltransferase [Thiothrix fructosivorans]MBO0614842.1 2-C-methyl-D-erythritol 4-phosphate cytidylyltransferase [Thiothrix fructosivorans]QTX09655.1 2-C-methyl-D-erythritol 4-phosphate cytidylyltransferase [Thiothrix fructosivorans]
MLNKVWVVIPAAGVGARMQADRPKQYLPLVGKTVIEHTLACFAEHPAVAGIVVAITDGDPYWAELTSIALSEQGTIHTAPGGCERADSVLNALDYLVNTLQVTADTHVLVHDAARPCLSRHDLDALLAAGASEAAGAILAVPVRDTMKRAQTHGLRISHTEERNGLWHALTPQMAALGVLRAALADALQRGLGVTDEASALEHAGLHPLLVEGDARNIKITRPADLALATFFLSNASSGQ